MQKMLRGLLLLLLLCPGVKVWSQNLPGDSIVYGPMFSPVYNDSVRVWVLTRIGTGATLTLELTQGTSGTPLTGTLHDSDTRMGYHLRSYKYANLAQGQTYTATVKRYGISTGRTSTITNGYNALSDFEFLAGGCGRIMDMTRCVDQVEGPLHVNGTTDIFKQMATENSDLMLWLGDAVYLFGIQHAGGMCAGMLNDWDTKDSLFRRYHFNRQFHDTLLRAMPQLAITDNHDVGGNEFNKTMPTLGIAKENFMRWWPNPKYTANAEGQGLYSSYRYKDVEFFLLDNRSYRESTTRHLGPAQLSWLKQALLNSTAPFKVLISGTPAFGKHHGGRNFAITTECDTMLRFIKANNINGVLCYSADIHQQEFYGRYNEHTYPFFDIVSGNLASDIGSGNTSINPAADIIFDAVIQTYARTNVYGQAGDRRFKVEYVSPNGVRYYGAIIHEDMLKSVDDSTLKLSLAFSNALTDSSKYHRVLQASGVTYGNDRNNNPLSAMEFGNTSSLSMPHTPELDMHDRTFSITYWLKPASLPQSGYASVFSNSTGSNGYSIGIDAAEHPVYVDHGSGQTYTAFIQLKTNRWAHIIWKYDNVKLQLMLYWNGRLVQKWQNVSTPQVSSGNLLIGNDVANRHFNGSIDEFHIYGKLIGDPTIALLSGYKPDRGQALSMSGVSGQNVVIPAAQLNPSLGTGFTTEFWARTTANPGTSTKLIGCHGRVNNLTTGYGLEFSAAKKVNVVVGNNTNSWLTIPEVGNPWQVGEWNHVALSVVPGDSVYCYINGNKVGSVKFNSYFSNNFGLGFGRSPAYADATAIEIDEFRLWNVPQSIDSIRRRMHYPLSGTESNLAFYYSFAPFTDTTVKSNGSNAYEMKFTSGGSLIDATDPVAPIDMPYRDVVGGSWSIRKTSSSGLSLEDPITGFTNNLVAGRDADSTIAPLSTGNNVYYLKGGWQLDALNIPLGTLNVQLSQCLPGYDTIAQAASEYYLLKEDSASGFVIVNTGYYDGQGLKFMNTFLDTGVYHIAWKRDTAAQLFDRGSALSLFSGNAAQIPNMAISSVLTGSFSIEFWCRLMQDPGTNSPVISSHGRVNNNTRGLSIEFQDGNSVNAVLGKDASDWNTIHSGKAWNIGEWNHVAVTGAPNGYLKLYVNGELRDSSEMSYYYPGNWDLGIGRSINYNNGVVAMVDELRIWKKVRSLKEIREQMHLPITSSDPMLAYNYTFNHADHGFALNTAAAQDSIGLTNARIIPSTAPVGNILVPQQYHVTGSWSLRDSANNGLSVLVSIPDFETNLVIGKDSLSGNAVLTGVQDGKTLNTLWQIDPLKLTQGKFEFDGPAVLGAGWAAVKSQAIEFYLLKRDATGQLSVQAVGNESNDRISFNAINMGYGLYTLGWKSNTTGLVETDKKTIRFYPNPSRDFITLDGIDPRKVAQVHVTTITGEYIPVKTEASGSDIRLNVGQLVPGTYMIVVTMKNKEVSALKFIKL